MVQMLFSNLELIAHKDREQRAAADTEEVEEGEGEGEGEGGVSVPEVEGDGVSRTGLDARPTADNADQEALVEDGM